MRFIRAIAFGTLVVVSAGVIGCGGGGVSVSGKVVKGAEPYSPQTDGDLSITLGAEGEGGSYTGMVEQDGTFEITSGESGGIPPGKYKISVTQYPKPGAGPSKSKTPPMPTSKETSEVWDVSSSNNTFTLDMSKIK